MENFIASARKYRPMTFESVIGQKALTQTLRNAISTNHISHAYLFSGPRGVGKTTCARIFAKSINCLNPSAHADACNECESCKAFNEQRSFNIHELDAASNNTVDDIRELINQVRIPPQIGKYSVFIIDEVHMLSSQAFNALLKTLEEPPSYAVFILATTEKHKVLPTIISRCQVYDFSRITIADTVDHLRNVASKEGIRIDDDALAVVAQKADGGMRDALSIFDQLVAFCNNDITYAQAIEVLNVLDTDYYFRTLDAIVTANVGQALLIYDEILSKGFDSQYFLSGFAKHLRDIVVSKDEQTLVLLEASENLRQRYAEQAQRISAKLIFEALRIVNDADINYRTAKNKRLTVELMLIRLCTLMQPASAPDNVPLAAAQPATPQPAQPVAPQPAQPATPQTGQQHTAYIPPSQAAARQAAPQNPTTTATPTTTNTANNTATNIATNIALSQADNRQQENAAQQRARAAVDTMKITQQFSLSSFSDLTTSNTPAPKTDVDTQPAKETTQVTTPQTTQQTNHPFTLNEAKEAWISLIGLIGADTRKTAILMDANLSLTDDNTIVVTLINDMQVNELKPLQQDIVSKLRQRLSNSSVKINWQVADTEYSTKAYTAEDRYELLSKRNSTLQQLTEQLDLQLE